MTDLLIRDIPDHIHLQIKIRAKQNYRSMSAEVLQVLHEVFGSDIEMPETPPEPLEGKFPITDEWVQHAREEGRP